MLLSNREPDRLTDGASDRTFGVSGMGMSKSVHVCACMCACYSVVKLNCTQTIEETLLPYLP